MKASVAAAFSPFQQSFEGITTFMYLDIKRLVTVAIGDLIDPIGVVRGLPWCIDGDPGQPADQDAVEAAWYAVKNAPSGMELRGGGAFASLTRIRLRDEGVHALVFGKASEMEAELRRRFPGWDSLPADAQLGTFGLAWACGADFRFPKLEGALKLEDFARYVDVVQEDGTIAHVLHAGCAFECGIDETGNPGVIRRNKADVALFEAAQRVVDQGLDPEVIYGWSAV